MMISLNQNSSAIAKPREIQTTMQMKAPQINQLPVSSAYYIRVTEVRTKPRYLVNAPNTTVSPLKEDRIGVLAAFSMIRPSSP